MLRGNGGSGWRLCDRQRTWRWAQREIGYAKDTCLHTPDLLGRTVHHDVSPLLPNEGVGETIDGVNRVLDALA